MPGIGASFYFVWLENHLERSNPREGLSGDLWAIHGGGIYHLEKYKLAPPQMPEKLHWFKWEAYATWLSGVTLLAVVYYLNAKLYLVAPGSDLSSAAAIGIGVASLVVGWFVYDLLCDSPLGKKPALLGAIPVHSADRCRLGTVTGIQWPWCIYPCGRHHRHHHGG